MPLLKESEFDISDAYSSESVKITNENLKLPFIRSFPLFLGWRKEDLNQLEKEGRCPISFSAVAVINEPPPR
jgi:hypothetical protein